MLVSDIKDKLEFANFHIILEGIEVDIDCGGFLNFYKEGDNSLGSIELEVEYTEEYRYLLMSEEEEDDNYPRCGDREFDYSNLEITAINIVKDPTDIYISDLNDKNELKRLNGCLEYFTNPYSWTKKTFNLFYKELDELLPIITPILGIYDFVQSEIYLNVEDEYYIEWVYKYNSRFVFRIHLDIFTHEFYMSPNAHKPIKDVEKFEEYFIENVLSIWHYGKGREIELEFKRFFSEDPKWTKDSCSEISKLISDIDFLKGKLEKNEKISLSKRINERIIPEEYNYLLDQYHKLFDTVQNP